MATVAGIVAETLVKYETEYFFCFMGGDHELWYALHDAGIRIINCRSEPGAVYWPTVMRESQASLVSFTDNADRV